MSFCSPRASARYQLEQDNINKICMLIGDVKSIAITMKQEGDNTANREREKGMYVYIMDGVIL